MVEREERELLLGSLRGYLEDLLDSGVDELFYAASSRTPGAAGNLPGKVAEAAVSGAGNPRARLLFVLNGAGFAAPSGELFSKIIQAMGFAPGEVYLLTFALGEPEGDASLRATLVERIAAVGPSVVVALGEPAAQLLLESREPISALRGRFLDLHGAQLLASLHPDQLLADAALKRQVWNEMQLVMARLKAP